MDAITKSVPTAITASIQFLAAFTFLFLLEPALAWAIPGLMLTMLTISKAYIKRMRSLNSNIRESESHVHTLMQESLQHRITINSFEQGDYIKENLTSRQSSLLGHVIDKTRYSIFTKSFVQAGFFTGYAAAFLWGVFGIIAGTVTFGTMTAFLQLVDQYRQLCRQIDYRALYLTNKLQESGHSSKCNSSGMKRYRKVNSNVEM